MERDCKKLKPRLMKEFVDAAETFDEPLTRITGSGLLWTGLRVFIFSHLHSDWMWYDDEIDILKIIVPESDQCQKSPPGEVCTDCSHQNKDQIDPKTPTGERRIIEIPRTYQCYYTGETRPLQLTEDLLGYFKVTDDYGRDTFPVLTNTFRRRVHRIVARADERMDGKFRRERGLTPKTVDWKDEPIPDVTPHDLRATLGTQMYRGNEGDPDRASLEQIAAELGHKSIKTTRKYADWTDAEVVGSGGRRSTK